MDRETADSAAPPADPGSQSLTVETALRNATDQLSGSSSAALDAQVLLGYALGKPRSYLLAWPEHSLNASQQLEFDALIKRRAGGEPVAYITGEREFWSLSFKVNKHTLIPRPETELLVESALELSGLLDTLNDEIHALDLGTGSGCIALSLAKEKPEWNIHASDFSTQALDVARHNANQLGINNVKFVQSNWFEQLGTAQFDLILCNPPYVADDASQLNEGDVRFEPVTALTAGADGLDAISILVTESFQRLKANGWIIFEIGYDQADRVAEMVSDTGYNFVLFKKDLAGIRRHCIAHRP